jgi:hypothetical protein
MKNILLLWMGMASWAVASGARGAMPADPNRIDLLLDAIARVESHNDPNATGDGGRALGPYQIHRAYWADGTRFLGVHWSFAEASDPQKAREVVRAYLLTYGRGCSLLEMARIHNGGPNGHRKPRTLKYARRIAALLEDVAPPTL